MDVAQFAERPPSFCFDASFIVPVIHDNFGYYGCCLIRDADVGQSETGVRRRCGGLPRSRPAAVRQARARAVRRQVLPGARLAAGSARGVGYPQRFGAGVTITQQARL